MTPDYAELHPEEAFCISSSSAMTYSHSYNPAQLQHYLQTQRQPDWEITENMAAVGK